MTDLSFGSIEPLSIDALPRDATISTASSELAALPYAGEFLGGRPLVRSATTASAVVGWGLRSSAALARRSARTKGAAFVVMEDGFLRSVGLGRTGAATISCVLDDTGIYFDARRPSRLEAILSRLDLSSEGRRAHAEARLERWRSERLSKYNFGDDRPAEAAFDRLVLIDQVAGDLSIAGAGSSAETFARMLDEALATRDAARLVVRTHPDVAAGRARGHLTGPARRHGIAIVGCEVSPPAILDAAAEIWTVSSTLGFEALLRGKPVVTFGMPFYAGWGLTRERVSGPMVDAARQRRGRALDVATLFAGAYLVYTRYADPVTRRATDFNGAVDRLLDWRARDRAAGAQLTVCYGFSRWKRQAARNFLSGSTGRLVFRRAAHAGALPADGRAPDMRIAVWGVNDKPGFAAACASRGLPLVRVEDGFLRSVGLGSDLLAPGSLVIDVSGIYYDADHPSDLETLLAQTRFDAALLARAQSLRTRIVAMALTKYNLPDRPLGLRAEAGGRPIALVVEQVPGDAAIRLGGGGFSGNLAFLEAVRRERGDHFVVYKEHPDLVAGNRRGRCARSGLLRFADKIVSDGNIATLYADVDELHAQSSLAGFEALLRGTRVVVWGRPFYAGWGLTDDRLPQLRRGRPLSLDALVAATLILYPRYVDPLSDVPCSVEEYLGSLADLVRRPGPSLGARGWLRRARRFGRWLARRT